MPKYRRKTEIVEAFQIAKDHWSNPSSWLQWFFEATQKLWGQPYSARMGNMDNDGLAAVEISAPNGVHIVYIGDFILCGVAGEIYPCDIAGFKKTYEPVFRTKKIDGRLHQVHE